MTADYSLFPIFDKFQGVVWRSDEPNKGECFCPAHDDGQKKDKKSLHLTIKPDEVSGIPKLLLHCHAGCSSGNILRASGETFSALFADRTQIGKAGYQASHSAAGSSGNAGAARARRSAPSPDEKIVAIYNYRDSAGEVLHQTIRYEPKRFTQRRRAEPHQTYIQGKREYRSYRDRQGKWWLNTLNGIEPVPFRLPDILAADPSKLIFFCEGEKDALRLAELGLLSTTFAMGAGKWRASYSEIFRGRRVAILPDFDKPRKGQTDPAANPGFDGAKKIAAELIGIAAEVRIVYLPDLDGQLVPKWDVSDWIAAGGTPEQFREAVKSSPILSADHPGLIPAGMNAEQAAAFGSSGNDGGSAGESSGESAGDVPAVDGKAQNVDIANYLITPDGRPEPISIRLICSQFLTACKGWPKQCNRRLYSVNEHYEVETHDNPASLIAMAGRFTQKCPDIKGLGHSKAEIFEAMPSFAERFDHIERYPHSPPIPGHYYACPPPPKIERRYAIELLDFFNPFTPTDRDLLLAFMMTVIWGGPAGSRPLFLLSGVGQGSGKTSCCQAVASLVGSEIQLSGHFKLEDAAKALLNGNGMSKRFVILDNLKSNRFSHADLESLITSKIISGHRLFVGEGSRPNHIIWVITQNSPELSRDLAQRTVWIKLGAPTYSSDWLDRLHKFINQYRWEIIADLIRCLQNPVSEIAAHSRWGAWESGVLSCLPDPNEAQAVILERRQELDGDAQASSKLEEEIASWLTQLGYRPDQDKIFLKKSLLRRWRTQSGEPTSSHALTSRIKIGKENGTITRLEPVNRRDARGFYWIGRDCPDFTTPYLDCERRWEEMQSRKSNDSFGRGKEVTHSRSGSVTAITDDEEMDFGEYDTMFPPDTKFSGR